MIRLLLVFLCAQSMAALAQTELIEPTLKSEAKAFAIIIDRQTYDHAKEAVVAYRNAVEADGLPTYIVTADFQTPAQVKEQILSLNQRKPSLEGVVFVGEIPIVKVRNAQHMTTAFKMNEDGFPIEQSSVPSDRFYDDFNLTFDYLQQDENNPLIHYYKLRDDSPQRLSPTIYSARIRYPKDRGGNPHEAIKSYLFKVAETKRSNVLDHFVSFTGGAYNSECLVAWRDDRKAYVEDFPFLGTSSEHFRQLNFRTSPNIKAILFEEMQREEVDLLLMRKHGTPTRELIGRRAGDSRLDGQIESLKSYFSTVLRRGENNKQNTDSLIEVYSKNYGLSASFFDGWDSEEQRIKDSLSSAEEYVYTADLNKLHTNPLYVILDACYNGSFDEDDYIAGSYIFNDGNTIAAQGNTRNVLQDTWTMNSTGLLSYGVRLGWVHNLNPSLENHLIGDPTFHFSNPGTRDLNSVLSQGDQLPADHLWELLKSDIPVYQSLALRMLSDAGEASPNLLLDYFRNSSFHTVRLQALTLLSRYNGPHFLEAVKLGLEDNYEMIARRSAIYTKKIGHKSLIPTIAKIYLEGQDRQRVLFNLGTGLQVFDKDDLHQAMLNVVSERNRIHAESELDELNQLFQESNQVNTRHAVVMDSSQDVERRIMHARYIRNSNYHYNVGDYLLLIEDSMQPAELRVVMAEALGWFNHSYRKKDIIDGLERIMQAESLPEGLSAEIQQTLIRLDDAN